MISRIKVIRGTGTDPYRNLAEEKILTLHAGEGECILFLWQNRDTVVIGRNQNAFAECDPKRLKESGVTLARRLSGGGAVFHDTGNLNYSFASRKADSDPGRQTGVILRAVRSLGIPAERTGRNDLETGGRKFSGCAFYDIGDGRCHHGTLMLDVDKEKMASALTPPPAKLKSRGVASVRSRVVNLCEYRPSLGREETEERLIRAFEEVYGLKAEKLGEEAVSAAEIAGEAAALASGEWILGRRIPFDAYVEGRFAWGGIRLEMCVRAGIITDAVCHSDAMDACAVREIAPPLRGCPYDGDTAAARLSEAAGDVSPQRKRMTDDIARMLREQIPHSASGESCRTAGTDRAAEDAAR